MAVRMKIAGQRLYIGSTPVDVPDADLVEADFATETWIEIKGWTTVAAIGDTITPIAISEVNRERDFVMGGTRNGNTQEQVFNIIPGDAGQVALKAAQKAGYNRRFKVVWPALAAPKANTVTITIAAPGVVSWTAHGLAAGTSVKLSTTGTLPTGLTAGTTYYVVSPTTDAFSLSATPGGAAITTTSTQTGVHTATTVPTGAERKYVGLPLNVTEPGGEANTAATIAASIAVNSNTVEKDALG
ncbi:hypothetical protein [Ancylobacter sp.]|uniref:hypothetical protein n=1 Tax=Ancylobacter sp. TaxID=1872567 RepID=UPI003D0ACD2C